MNQLSQLTVPAAPRRKQVEKIGTYYGDCVPRVVYYSFGTRRVFCMREGALKAFDVALNCDTLETALERFYARTLDNTVYELTPEYARVFERRAEEKAADEKRERDAIARILRRKYRKANPAPAKPEPEPTPEPVAPEEPATPAPAEATGETPEEFYCI